MATYRAMGTRLCNGPLSLKTSNADEIRVGIETKSGSPVEIQLTKAEERRLFQWLKDRQNATV